MNRYTRFLVVFLILSAPLFGKPEKEKEQVNHQKIYSAIDRGLVTVEYRAEMNFMGQSDDIEGRVMGLSVRPQGLIIFDGTSLGTGSHFGADAFDAPRVEKPKSLKVTDYRGNTFDAEFIGVDQFSLIAFCRLPDSMKNAIEAVEFKKGDLALGDDIFIFWLLPKGFEPRFQMARSIITSVISKPEKYYLTGELNTDFLMTPVVTVSGDLVGVITPVSQNDDRSGPFDAGAAFGTPVGIMPADRLQALLEKPPAPSEFKRGWMGIALQALNPDVAAFWNVDVPGGIIVTDVIAHSPAEKAGLKAGDFIVAVDDEPIDIKDDASLPVFMKTISELGAGGNMDMTVIRPGDTVIDTFNVAVALEETPISAGDAPRFEDKNFDMTVREIVFADYNVRNLDPDEVKGVIIDKLDAGGWADVDGLRAGDIIMKVNDRTVESIEECKKIFSDVEKDKKREVVFMIWRFNNTQFVNVKTHWG